ncbi:hypothetical protein C8T65DRAFT_250087 [Cerioporus squamosus]|nr:hypothetical protein C8T65DRAFT_250087 [Cerioporus squamosus]
MRFTLGAQVDPSDERHPRLIAETASRTHWPTGSRALVGHVEIRVRSEEEYQCKLKTHLGGPTDRFRFAAEFDVVLPGADSTLVVMAVGDRAHGSTPRGRRGHVHGEAISCTTRRRGLLGTAEHEEQRRYRCTVKMQTADKPQDSADWLKTTARAISCADESSSGGTHHFKRMAAANRCCRARREGSTTASSAARSRRRTLSA